jgi:hypothetical protein
MKKIDSDPMKDIYIKDKKHPLIALLSNSKTRFIMLKATSEDFLVQALRRSEWAFSQRTSDRLSDILN